MLRAIIAYVNKSGVILFGSFYFIGSGIILIFSVWYFFNRESKVTKELFKIIISEKVTVKMILDNVMENKTKLDLRLDEINALSSN